MGETWVGHSGFLGRMIEIPDTTIQGKHGGYDGAYAPSIRFANVRFASM